MWTIVLAVCIPLAFAGGVAIGWFTLKRAKNLPGPVGSLLAAPVTEQALFELVDDADEQDLIDDNQRQMITNIFELADVNAGDIMTHRMDMIAIEENTPCAHVLQTAVESGNSRLPIYRKTVDEVVGILYAKDLLRLFGDPKLPQRPVKQLARPAMFVPESRPAGQLLLDFKHQHTQIAIVVDEYGGTAGLVSMEDILEEIVGDIQDEYDNEVSELIANETGFSADGAADLEDVFEAFGLPLPEKSEDEEFDTVSGLVTDKLGRIPQTGEVAAVEWGGLRFQVTSAGQRRIQRVQCSRAQQTESEAL